MHLLRKLVTVGLFTALLFAQYANAVGLGEISLKSGLNQPLHAEIRLLNVRDLSASDILISLASPEDFQRAGVERLFFYNDLQFQVVTTGPGAPVVRITTQAPVREPYLNFLVEARWASGRLLREYTLLLDLPTFADEPARPVEAARQAPAAAPRPSATPTTQAPRQATQPAAEAPRAAPREGARGETYTVRSNDTLWEIALRVRPDSSVTVQQTMLGLQRQNPDAFINGNINLLRSGQILQIPTADEIRSLNNSQAVSQVAAQNREWAERTTGAQLDAGRRTTTERRQTQEVSGQVKLATTAPSEAAAGGQGVGEQQSAALTGQLSAAQEELEKSRRENTELSSRVRDLEDQIATMERLINVSNEQLRAMQVAAEQQGTEAPATPEEPVGVDEQSGLIDEPAVDEDPAITEEPAAVEETVEEVVATPVPEEPVAVAPPAQQPRVVRSAPRPKTLMDHVEENLIAIGLGIIALLIGVWYILHRRNINDGFDDDDYEDEEEYQAAGPDEDFSYDESMEDESTIDLAEEPLEPADDLFEEEIEEDLGAEAETGDVVGEADIYIAYGKLDQAEEMLLKGLSREPGSAPILLKLLEVYAEQQNVEAFDRHYAALLNTGDRTAIERAGELRAGMTGAGEFDATVLAVAAPAAVAATASSPAAKAEEDDFSFDLDDDVTETGLDFSLDDEEAAPTSKTDDLDDLNFDLEDDDTLALDDDFSLDLEDDLEPEAPLVSESPSVTSVETKYDMSFEETVEEDDDLSFDFDLEEQPVASPAPESELSLDDDDDFTLELEADDSVEPVKTATVDEDDDFSFELDELDEETEESEFTLSLEDDELDSAPAQKAVPATDADKDDEFDLDLAMSDMDLAALDDEMAALDADLDAGETTKPAPVEPDDLPALDDQVEAPSEQDLDDEMFEQALSGLTGEDASSAESIAADLTDEDMDAELDFLADTDEAATKLDLARAYIDMGDSEGAKDILSEVSEEGNEQQRKEAEDLLSRIDS